MPGVLCWLLRSLLRSVPLTPTPVPGSPEEDPLSPLRAGQLLLLPSGDELSGSGEGASKHHLEGPEVSLPDPELTSFLGTPSHSTSVCFPSETPLFLPAGCLPQFPQLCSDPLTPPGSLL